MLRQSGFVIVLMSLALVSACSSQSDPCEGQKGVCIRLRVEGDVAGLDQLRVALDKPSAKSQVSPAVAASFSLPVQVALVLPSSVTGDVGVAVDGLAAGQPIATAATKVAISGPGAYDAKVTLRAGTSDLADAQFVIADLAGDAFADLRDDTDLVGFDLAESDFATSPDDLSVIPDLTVSPDLVVIPDLVSVPDLLFADLAPAPNSVNVALTKRDGANGSVSGTSSPPQPNIDCGASCAQSYSVGTTVTLTANPAANWYFGGWTGACTGMSPTCTITTTAAPINVRAVFTPANVQFTTSTAYTVAQIRAAGTGATAAALAVSGADAICNSVASSAGITGHFVAWFRSSSGTTPIGRLKNANPDGVDPLGWVRRDGNPFVDNFTSPHVYYPPALSESGGSPAGDGNTGYRVWTGEGSFTCSDWSSSASGDSGGAGIWSAGGGSWYGGYSKGCADAAALYCMQADYRAALTPPPRPTARKFAFVTTAAFVPSTGLAGADLLCSSEAMSAGLTTTANDFVALLAPTGASVASRVSPSVSLPYIRPDNVVVVDKGIELFMQSKLFRAPIGYTADGGISNFSVWFGSNTAMGTATDNCANWTSNQSSASGVIYNIDFSSFTFLGYSTGCSNTASIFCVQK